MRVILALAALGLAVAAPASAQNSPALTVSQFLERWNGVNALPDQASKEAEAALLARVLGGTLERYQGLLRSDEAGGKPPRACPKKESEDRFDFTDLVAHLEALPAPWHLRSLDDGVFDFLDKRYPCAAASG